MWVPNTDDVDDIELLTTTRLLRSRSTGKYYLDCDFTVHAEVRAPFETVEAAFDVAKVLVRDELKTRPRTPERDPFSPLTP